MIKEQLDKVLASVEWFSTDANAMVINMENRTSNNCIIMLESIQKPKKPKEDPTLIQYGSNIRI